jgi:hypothetical protein
MPSLKLSYFDFMEVEENLQDWLLAWNHLLEEFRLD